MPGSDPTARSYPRRRRGEITVFYAPPPVADDGTITLGGEEAHHARTVCRLSKGSPITVVDGQGLAHFCEVLSASPRKLACRIFKSVKNWGEPPVTVDLAAGLSKGTKFDLTCEKATELGVKGIIPFVSEKSAVKADDPTAAGRKVARYRRLTLAAMKQSLRSVWPIVSPVCRLADLLPTFDSYHRILAGDPTAGSISFDRAGELISSARKILLIIGPEGGMSTSEIALLRENGAYSVSLGPRRLRTETAAIVFVARIMGVFEA